MSEDVTRAWRAALFVGVNGSHTKIVPVESCSVGNGNLPDR